MLKIGRNEEWYIRYWCRTFESGEFEGGGKCLSCGSGEEAELSTSTGCVESVLTSAYFLVSQNVTVASDASYLWTYRIYIPSLYFTFRSQASCIALRTDFSRSTWTLLHEVLGGCLVSWLLAVSERGSFCAAPC